MTAPTLDLFTPDESHLLHLLCNTTHIGTSEPLQDASGLTMYAFREAWNRLTEKKVPLDCKEKLRLYLDAFYTNELMGTELA